MITLTTTAELADFCAAARQTDYVTLDTEFLRERTYYSKLCLLQMAYRGDGETDAVLVDPLAGEMSLGPLYELFADTSVVKVFHAARQDLEIFFFDEGGFPMPLFDTQVAAMVCGFGEQVGYETLVKRIAKAQIDKSSRFTDWSRRPLTDAQKVYALADVTHLRDVYEYLSAELERTDRARWVQEELQGLVNPEIYTIRPAEAWKRVKTRTTSARFMAIVQVLAEYRETYAQTNNVPRNRVFKDDVLLELASTKPRSHADLKKSRLLQREARRGDIAEGILSSVERGAAMPAEQAPRPDRTHDRQQVNQALADLLRVLLKAKAEGAGVAQKLIATAAELDNIAAGGRDGLSLRGWRAEVFGADALRLCDGEIALAAEGNSVRIVDL